MCLLLVTEKHFNHSYNIIKHNVKIVTPYVMARSFFNRKSFCAKLVVGSVGGRQVLGMFGFPWRSVCSLTCYRVHLNS